MFCIVASITIIKHKYFLHTDAISCCLSENRKDHPGDTCHLIAYHLNMITIKMFFERDLAMPEKQPPAPGLIKRHCVPSAAADSFSADPAALQYLALDAYIYGYPLVLTEVTKTIMLANGACINQFLQERVFPDPRYTTIVRPNGDTLYTMAWLDLSREPVVLSLPDTHNRYYLMELLDPWTNVFASLGARTTGTRQGAYAVTGPRWNGRLPEGIIRVDSPANAVWIIGRTQTNGPQDFPAVHAIQNGYTLIPLSCWGKPTIPGFSSYRQKPLNTNPADQVAAMDAAAFYQTMMRAMSANPPWIIDPAMKEKLAALGLAPSRNFDYFNLSPSVKPALQSSAVFGPKFIKDQAAKKYVGKNKYGWFTACSNIGFYGADYLQRAMVALAGIGANLPQDAVYAAAFSDTYGAPLAGYNNYLLHFDKAQLPPVQAFWSLTLYNPEGYLVANRLHRFAVSPHLGSLDYRTDGSLDIYIGNTPPEDGNTANWLPAPAGRFNLVLRMYWPEQPVLCGQWQPPAIQQT
jgi:hypothetical protein